MGSDIADYKFFCFDGRPQVLYVATDRSSATETKFDFFDMDFRHLDIRNGHPNAQRPPLKPECFEQMKSMAAELSKGMHHVRVDFYQVQGRVYFGEYTFYHWGGFVPFDPDSADVLMGSFFEVK